MLAGLLAAMNFGGVVTACGMAGGGDLPTTVYPFIIRGVTLVGIDSAHCPRAERQRAWDRLAEITPWRCIEPMFRTIRLADVISASQRLLAGDIRGRIVVKIR